MTIEKYIRAKEDLEVALIGAINNIIVPFENETGLSILGVDTILFSSNKLEGIYIKDSRVSDVNVMTNIEKRRTY